MTDYDAGGYPIDDTDGGSGEDVAPSVETRDGGLSADVVVAELQKAIDGPDGFLKSLAAELLAIRGERAEAARLSAIATQAAADEGSGLSIYEQMEAGTIDEADVRLVVAGQWAAEQDAYEKRVLENVRQKKIEEGADSDAVEAAVESRKRDLASMRAEYAAADPLDQDVSYHEHRQRQIEAVAEREVVEEALRARENAWDGFEVIDGRLVSTSDLIAATLAARAG